MGYLSILGTSIGLLCHSMKLNFSVTQVYGQIMRGALQLMLKI